MKTARLVSVFVLGTLLVSDVRAYHDQQYNEWEEPEIEDYTYHEEVSKSRSETKLVNVDDQQQNDEYGEKVSYKGYQLWKLRVDTPDKFNVVGTLKKKQDISTWGGNRTFLDVLVSEDKRRLVKQQLDQNQIDYDVTLDDLQKAINEENPPTDDDEEELAHRNGHRMTWNSYHRVSDIHQFMDYLAKTYPSLCKIYVIGTSTQGRPLKVLRISNGSPTNKAVWVDGGIHAREWITPATVTYIINDLVLNFEHQTDDIKNIDWYFLPVANPDGYEYSHTRDRLWRKNRARGRQCIGTDLNRNYGYKWGGAGSGKHPCQDTYGGVAAFSERETAAIRNFVQGQNVQWKASISYHSYGQYILYPWGYINDVPSDYHDLQRVGEMAAQAMRQAGGAIYTVGPAARTLYPAAGGSDDWAKGDMKMKYTYTIELRDNGRYGFVLPATFIIPTAKEGLAALKVIGKAVATA